MGNKNGRDDGFFRVRLESSYGTTINIEHDYANIDGERLVRDLFAGIVGIGFSPGALLMSMNSFLMTALPSEMLDTNEDMQEEMPDFSDEDDKKVS